MRKYELDAEDSSPETSASESFTASSYRYSNARRSSVYSPRSETSKSQATHEFVNSLRKQYEQMRLSEAEIHIKSEPVNEVEEEIPHTRSEVESYSLSDNRIQTPFRETKRNLSQLFENSQTPEESPESSRISPPESGSIFNSRRSSLSYRPSMRLESENEDSKYDEETIFNTLENGKYNFDSILHESRAVMTQESPAVFLSNEEPRSSRRQIKTQIPVFTPPVLTDDEEYRPSPKPDIRKGFTPPNTNQIHGLKRKLIQKEEDEPQKRKYEKRTRIKPIEHWKNERLVYDEDGYIIGVDLADESQQQFIREGTKRRRLNPNARDNQTAQLFTGTVIDRSTGQEVLKDLIFRNNHLKFVREEESEPAVAMIGDFGEISSFILQLRPREVKSQSLNNAGSIVGTVLSAVRDSIILTIHTNTFSLSQFDSFTIPSSNYYSIENLSYKKASKILLVVSSSR
jgi:hypothetical protein